MGWGIGVPVGFFAAIGGVALGAGAWFLTASPWMTFIFALVGAVVAGGYAYKQLVQSRWSR